MSQQQLVDNLREIFSGEQEAAILNDLIDRFPAILGRPSLNIIWVIISLAHEKPGAKKLKMGEISFLAFRSYLGNALRTPGKTAKPEIATAEFHPKYGFPNEVLLPSVKEVLEGGYLGITGWDEVALALQNRSESEKHPLLRFC